MAEGTPVVIRPMGELPPPPLRLKRKLAGLVLVAAVAGGVWWLTRADKTSSEVSAPGPDGGGPTALTAAGVAPTALSLTDPFEETRGAPLRTEAAKAGLSSKLSVTRVETLKALAARGADGRDLVPLVQPLLTSDNPEEIVWAKAVLMKLEVNRRFAKELAGQAAEHPEFAAVKEAVLALDPATGDALLRAATEAAARKASPSTPELAGLSEVVERLATDPVAGAVAVTARLREAGPQDLPVWMRVAEGLRPLPKDGVSALIERAKREGPETRTAVFTFLGTSDVDLSQAGDDLAAAMRAALDDDADPMRFAVMRTISRLPRADEALTTRLLDFARRDEAQSATVLATLSALGPRAAGASKGMLALAPSLPEAQRPLLTQALLASGGDEVAAYAAERLATAGDVERFLWLDGLSSAKEASPLVASLSRLIAGPDEAQAAAAVATLARVDPGLRSPDTSRLLMEALSDRRALVRAAASKAVGSLSAPPVRFLDPLVARLTDTDPAARAAAVETVTGVFRWGPDAKPFVPALLQLLESPDLATDAPQAPARALRSLVAANPLDPAVRAACRKGLEDSSADVRLAAAYGLARLSVPTAQEKAALWRHKDEPALQSLATEALARPSWQAVGAQ